MDCKHNTEKSTLSRLVRSITGIQRIKQTWMYHWPLACMGKQCFVPQQVRCKYVRIWRKRWWIYYFRINHQNRGYAKNWYHDLRQRCKAIGAVHFFRGKKKNNNPPIKGSDSGISDWNLLILLHISGKKLTSKAKIPIW